MRHVASAAALSLASLALVPTTADAAPGVAASTCLGKPVTIVATTDVTVGTEGDDVVAMTPSGWNSFDALGGNDTICLAVARGVDGPRDNISPTGLVNAGAGNDVVVNEATPEAGAEMSVGLGLGDDSFTGNGTATRVTADSDIGPAYDRPLAPQAGAQRDLVDMGTGGGYVTTAAPVGELNNDRITFGGGNAQVVYVGAMGPEGLVDVTAATGAWLQLPEPGVAGPLGSGELLVDNVAGRASVGAARVLAWNGRVSSFRFGWDATTSSRLPVSFAGSDGDETVTVAGGPIGDVELGAGDDRLELETEADTFVPRSAAGGRGQDSVLLQTNCLNLWIDAARRRAACDGSSGAFGGFETLFATAERRGSSVTLVGTNGPDDLGGRGDRVTLRGLGGSDRLSVDTARTTRVYGGAGVDRIRAAGDDVVVKGQSGPDDIALTGSAGYLEFAGPAVTKQQVAFGGRGDDAMIGTSAKRGDRLVGGRGDDRANGRDGAFDHCVAEKVKNCERT